tara:strand:- start:259 stop:1023 length:765 start_codon:yes stop_codon:yes gene_type:complete
MITLLNGEAWGKDEILTQMYDDEFYYGHLGKYALSSSSLKTILKSPKTYRNIIKYGSVEDTPALRAGKLLHWMVLEPHKIDRLEFVDVSSKNAKVYKEALSKHGEVYLEKEKQDAERLTDALLRNEEAIKLINKSEFEVPALEMLDGFPVRGKADILKEGHIIDLKSSQDLNGFRYSADKFGYDLQAYIYKRLFKASKVTFLVIDKGSCDIGIFDASDEFIARGKDKFKQATDLYKYFFVEEHDLDQYVMRGIL